MRIVGRIIDILVERLFPIVGGLLSSRFETIAVLEQAEHQNELEERARQFEQEGKPQLAAALRVRASQITPDNPAGQGVRITHQLQMQQTEGDQLLLVSPDSTEEEQDTSHKSDCDPLVRRPTDRRGRRPASPQ